jgi:hypothetical protein
MNSEARSIISPNHRFEASLAPVHPGCDIHASLALHGLSFGARLFSWEGIWSPDSRHFVAVEWRRESAFFRPDMRLIVVDIHSRKECIVDQVRCGFIETLAFPGDEVIYTWLVRGMGDRVVKHRRLDELTGWRPLSDRMPEWDE